MRYRISVWRKLSGHGIYRTNILSRYRNIAALSFLGCGEYKQTFPKALKWMAGGEIPEPSIRLTDMPLLMVMPAKHAVDIDGVYILCSDTRDGIVRTESDIPNY